MAYAMEANRSEAERISGQLAAWDPPSRFGTHTLWRAFIAANLGDLEEAVQLLEQSVEEGALMRLIPHTEPSLKPLRGFPAFEEFARPKG